MTTTIKISAHCASNKEVAYIITDRSGEPIDALNILQDGEEATLYVYDDRELSVFERMKNEQQTQG
jgi:hypothetical protein